MAALQHNPTVSEVVDAIRTTLPLHEHAVKGSDGRLRRCTEAELHAMGIEPLHIEPRELPGGIFHPYGGDFPGITIRVTVREA